MNSLFSLFRNSEPWSLVTTLGRPILMKSYEGVVAGSIKYSLHTVCKSVCAANLEQCQCCLGGTLIRCCKCLHPFGAIITARQNVSIAGGRWVGEGPYIINPKVVPGALHGNGM